MDRNKFLSIQSLNDEETSEGKLIHDNDGIMERTEIVNKKIITEDGRQLLT
jgi:hypothetical protein